ncbi:MAG: DUF2237 domain-containing protein [Planctomycetota bacterium]|nr:DUF2237 domain-containing protein [Planctomycetota bacterium]MEC8511666.1 DUF2237 domain-containing protein [Planctomycetota bacterium]
MIQRQELNVLGEALEVCCTDPMTGFFRDGACRTGPDDLGSHTVCARVTAEFLEFSRSRGNDLSTPRPEFSFPGLRPGDCWCLCALRWREALEAGCAPRVRLAACHSSCLEAVSLDDLRAHALETD